MNKPVIKGTTGHSALLAKAEEMARTHGGDPIVGAAAAAYGESMSSPDVIDYRIKSREIEFDKKEKEEKTEKEITTTTTNTTNNIIERRIQVANDDSEAAEDRSRKHYESIEMRQIPTTEALELLPEATLEEKITKAKKLEKKGTATTTGAIAQSVGGASTQNLKTSYTKEEQERWVFSEKHMRYVLPEEIGIEPDVIIESKKLDRKIKRATKKSQIKEEKKVEQKEVKPTTTKPIARRNVALEAEYKTSSDWKQKQMRNKRPNYPWPK